MNQIIRDEGKLQPDFVPEELTNREEEKRRLKVHYSRIFDGKVPRHVFITGRSGMGKTTLARRFFSDLADQGRKKGVMVDLIYVDCKGATPIQVMHQILVALDVIPSPKTCLGQLSRILKATVHRRNSIVFVLMDEAYIPIKKDSTDGDSLIHCLTRLNQMAPGQNVSLSLCMIANRDVLGMLEDSTKGMFPPHNIIRLDKYPKSALLEIIIQRIELAFHPGTVAEESCEMITEISTGPGDARYAVGLLHYAGLDAESKGADEVTPEHVRAAKAEIEPHITETMLSQLDDHERILLLSIARLLKKASKITLKDARAAYMVECEGYEMKPRGFTQMKKYLMALAQEDILTVEKAGHGKTATMMIGLDDVPAAVLVERLEKLTE